MKPETGGDVIIIMNNMMIMTHVMAVLLPLTVPYAEGERHDS